VYVQENGALGFTQAHSASIPAGAVTMTFTLTQLTTGIGVWSFTGLGANSFFACPSANGGSPYQVFVNVAEGNFDNCIGFDADTANYTGGAAAWQYV
jgi:hypothetical protein